MKPKQEHKGWVTAQYRIIKFLATLFSFIPRNVLAFLAIPMGRIWYFIDRHHRNIALGNLRRAFSGEKSEKEIRKLVRSNFIRLTCVGLEILSLLRLRKNNLHRYATLSNRENLQQAIDQGKGVLILTAHFGNWELMALCMSLVFDTPIYGVARPLDYRPLDMLLREIRSRTGNGVIEKKNGAARIVRVLHQKHVIGILLDQNASWYDGVYVPFFGQTACTHKSLAMFALRYDVPVVPVFNIRRPDGRYEILFEPPLALIRTGELGQDILENTALFNRTIEKYIRMAPDNWLWVHNRWRKKNIPPHYRDKLPQVTLPPSSGPGR